MCWYGKIKSKWQKEHFNICLKDIPFIISLEINTLSLPLSVWVTMTELSISDKKLFSIAHAASVPLSPSYRGLSDRPGITAGLGRAATSLSASNAPVCVCLTSWQEH